MLNLKEPELNNMKKLIALLLVFTFMAVVAGASFARTIDEEKMAVRGYLSILDAKIIKARKANDTKKVAVLQADKKATLARWEKIKAEAGVAPTPTPAEAPTAPTAGMGLSLGGRLGTVAGGTGIIGNLDYSIASWIPGTKVRLTADYLTGTNSSVSYKVVDLGLGAIYALDMLKADFLPINWYTGGSFLLPVKVSGGATGSYGATAFVGGNYNIPDFGTILAELGYSGLKYNKNAAAVQGLFANVGYSYSF